MGSEAINPLAAELNQVISGAPSVFSMLSKRGREIYFPKKGIVAQSAEAKGKRLNATIGEAVEDDHTPMRLKSLEKLVNLSPEKVFPYTPSSGKPELRNKWKEMMFRKNPGLKGKEIGTPVVTAGLTHGLSVLGYLFVDPEDTVYVADLYWENYNLIFENACGGKIENFRLFKDGKIDIESMRETLMKSGVGKKILILNYPNNPSGYTPTIDEAKAIVKTIAEVAEKGSKIVVLTDDAYFGLFYEDNILEQSIFCDLADLSENVLAVKADGPTKEDYVWGFRIGFFTFGIKGGTKELYNALEMKAVGAIRGNISNMPHISQSMLLAAYECPTYEGEKKEKYEILNSRYHILKKTLADNPKFAEVFEPYPFNSGYFMCVKTKAGIDTEKVRKILLEKYETGVITMPGLIRVAFSSLAGHLIPELFENLYKACKEAL